MIRFNTAYRAACKSRAARRVAETCPVIVHALKKDGTPSKMHDAIKREATRESALAYVAYVRSLNPGRTLRYSIDGTEV